jgi:hypothetical protein
VVAATKTDERGASMPEKNQQLFTTSYLRSIWAKDSSEGFEAEEAWRGSHQEKSI